MIIANNKNIPFVLQVWLAADNYDYQVGDKYLSATTLLRSPRQIILERRVDTSGLVADIEDSIARTMGNAIHEGIESAWMHNLPQSLKVLGQESIKDMFTVNPKPEEDLTNKIPIYIEQRTSKEIDGFTIGGKFDFVADGVLHDFKTTSVYSYIHGDRVKEYKLQGSIYRWLNQDKIKNDFIRICYIFTDWSKAEASRNPEYPQCRCLAKEYELLSVADTEQWIKNKLAVLSKYWDAPDSGIPECTDEELWLTPTQYKYYTNPENTRATKNFDVYGDAIAFQRSKGKGVVITVPGAPQHCAYCSAAPICQQRKRICKE
jgi:hypothetical protein